MPGSCLWPSEWRHLQPRARPPWAQGCLLMCVAFLCPGIAPGAHRCPSSSHTLTFGSRAVSRLGEEQVGPLLQLPEALGLG